MVENIKFGRKYTLLVDTVNDTTIEIKPPLTLEFNCKRNNLATANTASFKIYNLKEVTRNSIYKDKYNTLIYRKVELKAGYKEDSPIIFRGNILQAFSYRSGVNIITEITAYDGGFAISNSISAISVEKEEPQENVLATLVNDLRNVQGSRIGTFTRNSTRGRVLFGNTADLLVNETNDNFFIDNEKAYLLNRNEVIESGISIINAQSGLLESPRRSETQIIFKMLFEPQLQVSQIIELQSVINSILNGQYKVIGFEHIGTISEAVGGKCETNVSLWLGSEPLTIIGG